MKKIIVATTFHEAGYNQYGKLMLETFDKYWPKHIELHCYCENINPTYTSKRIFYHDLLKEIPELVAFKNRHINNPKANGMLRDETDRSKKPKWLGFRWDAVRFSHKSFVIYESSKLDTDLLIWLDADTKTFDTIPDSFFETILNTNQYCAFLGRHNKYTETGFLLFNTKHSIHKDFMEKFISFYRYDYIFSLKEWHDCECFDESRKEFQKKVNNFKDINTIPNSNGHPFVNSILGKYMDHLKGNRKKLGGSSRSDLKIQRTEEYWKKVKR